MVQTQRCAEAELRLLGAAYCNKAHKKCVLQVLRAYAHFLQEVKCDPWKAQR